MTLAPTSSRTPRARSDERLAALGILHETYPRGTQDRNAALVDGRAQYQAVYLHQGDAVRGAAVWISVAGAAVTLSKVGLYDEAGTRRAISADQGTAWQSTGLKDIAFTAPFTVGGSGLHYLACIAKATTTMPQMPETFPTTELYLTLGSFARIAAQQAGLTDLPAAATFADTSLLWWMAALL